VFSGTQEDKKLGCIGPLLTTASIASRHIRACVHSLSCTGAGLDAWKRQPGKSASTLRRSSARTDPDITVMLTRVKRTNRIFIICLNLFWIAKTLAEIKRTV
jgi:hypothetical protein